MRAPREHMAKRTRSFEPKATAALTRRLMVMSSLVLGAGCGRGTGEPGPVEPIHVAPSSAETMIRGRGDSHATLPDVLHLLLQHD